MMYIKNPFRMKDWPSGDFIKLIIIINVLFLIFTFLNYNGFPTLFFDDILGFLLILFIPGTLLIRFLDLGRIESKGEIIVYTIGLSLVCLMLIGFLMNLLYPFFGITKPLSSLSILITVEAFIVFTSLLTYLMDRERLHIRISRTLNHLVVHKSHPHITDLKESFTPYVLIPFLLPILSIIGAYAMNVYHFNGLTIVMILFTALITLMAITGRFPQKLYPLIIFLISISLLFHKSLITNYIWGWDINSEYFLANQVISNSIWNENLPVSYNSMLSVMILAPILNCFINCGLVWIMKVVYPFIFSLVPLGLYYVFRKQTSSRIAFLSVFFFIIQFTFYTEMLTLVRQQIAELMLVLVLMIIISTPLDMRNRSILVVIFGMSIIVAHYGLASIMMIILILSIIIIYVSEKEPLLWFKNYWVKLLRLNPVMSLLILVSSYFPGLGKTQLSISEHQPNVREKLEKYRSMERNRVITSSFIILLLLFLLTWYIYTSNSTIFQSLVDIMGNIVENLYSFMDPTNTQGLNLVMEEQVTPLRNLHKYFYLSSQFLISIGILALILGKDGMNFNREYKAISLATFLVLLAGVVIPFFSSQMNTTRLYHVALIILAPYCVVGMLSLLNFLKSILKFKIRHESLLKIFSIYFIIFLCFDTGMIYQALDSQHPTSIALNDSYDFPKFNQYELQGGYWLHDHSHNNQTVYADKYRSTVLGSILPCNEIPSYFDLVSNQSYIFLGTLNLERGQILVYRMVGSNIVIQESYQSPQEIIKSRSRVYDNGGSVIYNEINV